MKPQTLGSLDAAHPTKSPPAPSRISRAVEAIAAWLSGARGPSGLGQLDPREIENMARDIGLSSSELARAVAGSNGSTAELARLLEALSLDARDLSANEPGTMRDLSRMCAGCGDKRRCRQDIASGVVAKTYRDYCPNTHTVDALVEEQKRKA